MPRDASKSMSTSFTTIKPVQRAQEVHDQLARAIANGDYQPGDRLPSERELGQAFGVSRVSVREAMRGLQAIGLVEVVHGRGCFVSKGPGERYRSPFAVWLHVHRDEVLELMKVRGALDELAAHEAAARKDPPAVAKLERAHRAFEQAVRAGNASLDELVRLDIDYHLAIADASGSRLVHDLLEELNDRFAQSRKIVFAQASQTSRSVEQHGAIVTAIAAGDPRKARAATAAHIVSTLAALEDPAPTGA
jgi:DNA-binding FadR family transcriptional regulator